MCVWKDMFSQNEHVRVWQISMSL